MKHVSRSRTILVALWLACVSLMLVTMLSGCGNKEASTNKQTSTTGKLKATLEPSSGKQGSTIEVKIVGYGTHFVDGNTDLNFAGDPTSSDIASDIEVNSTTVTDATHAVSNITIPPDAKTGSRSAFVSTTKPKWESADTTFAVTSSLK